MQRPGLVPCNITGIINLTRWLNKVGELTHIASITPPKKVGKNIHPSTHHGVTARLTVGFTVVGLRFSVLTAGLPSHSYDVVTLNFLLHELPLEATRWRCMALRTVVATKIMLLRRCWLILVIVIN